ncbi:WD repeat and FYVE domain containing 2 [Rhinolophus ferrumequinum]|uniref:WD repeat and FYVE domain containing 2 n=1 Tax=Rhinolophus ferrumequinum TaxID=59479 RepID=A0A7J7ZS98_RHIFE|nr:WD repeat and FYVE domain containing 2 [Rhinolophus ferrumequinum]
MAAEIQPKPLTRKPILLQRVEGSQEVVNMAVIVPKEEGVISVSEDRYFRITRMNILKTCTNLHHTPYRWPNGFISYADPMENVVNITPMANSLQ